MWQDINHCGVHINLKGAWLLHAAAEDRVETYVNVHSQTNTRNLSHMQTDQMHRNRLQCMRNLKAHLTQILPPY